MVVVLLGPPGAGKGTQASLIANYYNLRLISMGDFLRQESKKNSDIGKQISSYMEEGHLVPDEIIIRIIEHLIGDPPSGLILDGFPRNLNQTESLVEMLKTHKDVKLIAIELFCSDEDVIKRLSARRQCPECNRIYNLQTNPPEDDEICDDCKIKIVQRNDDRPEIVKKRLAVYHQETKPIIAYFERIGEFHRVAVDGDIALVFEHVRKIIDGYTT